MGSASLHQLRKRRHVVLRGNVCPSEPCGPFVSLQHWGWAQPCLPVISTICGSEWRPSEPWGPSGDPASLALLDGIAFTLAGSSVPLLAAVHQSVSTKLVGENAQRRAASTLCGPSCFPTTLPRLHFEFLPTTPPSLEALACCVAVTMRGCIPSSIVLRMEMVSMIGHKYCLFNGCVAAPSRAHFQTQGVPINSLSAQQAARTPCTSCTACGTWVLSKQPAQPACPSQSSTTCTACAT